MPTRHDVLVSYVPVLLTRRLAAASQARPAADAFPAAVLFADISGFTSLTEQLAQRGPEGAELLTTVLNGYFSDFIELVASWGGDVAKFAGDALLAVWPEAPARDLSACILAATQSGRAMQRLIEAKRDQAAVSLSLRVGIGAGEVVLSQVGGLNGHWEFMLTGQPLIDLALAQQQAQPGELLLTGDAWQRVADQVDTIALDSRLMRVEAVRSARATGPLVLPSPDEVDEQALWRYLPTAIHARLMAEQMGWLAELRQVTAIFINLTGIHLGVSLDLAQAIVLGLEKVIDRYEGSVNKLSVDDKGVTLVAAFGLPPLSHEDDALRSIKAAFDIQETLKALGVAHAIGMATGRAFCGEVGNDRRREYTMIGDPINLAARLMQAATREGILCDRKTADLLHGRVAFHELEPLRLKGKSQPVPLFRPTAVLQKAELPPTSMVGRVAEREALAQALQALIAGESERIWVEAEAGMGKSRLVADMLETASALSLTVLQGAADAVEKSTPYHAWRAVFAAMTDQVPARLTPEARRQHVLGTIRALLIDVPETDWAELLPLLNPYFPLELSETPLMAQMPGQARADNTDKLLVLLLQGYARAQRVVLVIDDGHWLDSASLRLLKYVSASVHPLLLVVATRPVGDPVPADFRALKELFNVMIQLKTLSFEETMSLVCKRLRVSSLPESVSALIKEKAEGHPFFSEELAFSLRDAGILLIENGACRVSEEAGDVRLLNLPTTIEGVITNRVDRLTPSAQLAIKVASVIGRVFAYQTLRDVFPIEAERSQLSNNLQVLERLDLTPLEAPPPALAYIFKHIITQEVVYNLMLFSQRQQLHRLVAEWIEQAYSSELEHHYPLLAHHWSKAEVQEKASFYLEKAGDHALQTGAYPEAIRFYDEALALAEAGKVTLSKDPLARYHQQLGKAHLGMGNITQSEAHCFKALSTLGQPFPATLPRMIAALLAEVFLQALHRFFPRHFTGKPLSAERSERLLLSARVSEILYELFIFNDKPIGLLYASLRTLNQSEQAPANPPLVGAYGMMSVIASSAKSEGLADCYERLAFAASQQVDELPVLVGVYIRLAARYLTSGQWAKSIQNAQQAITICNRMSDTRKWAESLALCANAKAYQGHLEESLMMFKNIYTESRRIDANQFMVWGASGAVTALTRLGRFDEALAFLDDSASEFETTADQILNMAYHGQRASMLLQHGRDAEAWAEAVTTERKLAAHSTTYAFESTFGLCEVAITFCLRQQTPIRREEAIRLARQGLKFARATTGMFPAGRSQTLRWQGLFAWSQAKRSRALSLWRKSLQAAEAFEMPFERAQAHLELGLHLEAGSERERHLQEAQTRFATLGAAHERARAQRALQPLPSDLATVRP